MLSHQAFIIDVPTIFAWDTDDSTEETRSGKRTAHITGGIIIQREQSITTELMRWYDMVMIPLSTINLKRCYAK